LKEKAEEEQKFCGNCTSHNAYDYPDQVFCTRRFLQDKNPVVRTLWHCEEWNANAQECHCIEDASKKEKQKT
jgi:hypothetical protein